MKKLIMAAAAITAGLAIADSSVVSSDIVGYQAAELQQYGLTVGACFVPVTGSNFDLTDLKVTGFDEVSDGDVQIQTLDYAGRTAATFTYYYLPDDDLVGWLDGSDEPVEPGTVTFQAGEGLWSYSQDDGFGLQSAGKVPTTGVTVNLQQYGLSVANPTPVNVDLTGITIGGYEETSDGDVQIQTLDYAGRTVATYTYYDLPEDELFGWLDETDEPVEAGTVVVKPGEGLWTYSQADGFTLTFPGVSL